MPPTEQEQFLKDLEPNPKNDPFEQPIIPEAPVEETPQEPTEEEKFNRRERRQQAKLQAEREANIALAARLEAITDAQRARQESEPAEYLKSIERIYGTGSPEASEATELLKTALQGVERRATESALTQLREEQRQSAEAIAKEEKTLDGMIEEIEDETGQTMDAQTRTGFFSLLEKLSPKNEQGEVTAYADHYAVWEELQARKQPKDTRAKDLASRSMVRTGASPDTSVGADAQERWLRENGLI